MDDNHRSADRQSRGLDPEVERQLRELDIALRDADPSAPSDLPAGPDHEYMEAHRLLALYGLTVRSEAWIRSAFANPAQADAFLETAKSIPAWVHPTLADRLWILWRFYTFKCFGERFWY